MSATAPFDTIYTVDQPGGAYSVFEKTGAANCPMVSTPTGDSKQFPYGDLYSVGTQFQYPVGGVPNTFFSHVTPVVPGQNYSWAKIEHCKCGPGVWFNPLGNKTYQAFSGDASQGASAGVAVTFAAPAVATPQCPLSKTWHGEVTQGDSRPFIPVSVLGSEVSLARLKCGVCTIKDGSAVTYQVATGTSNGTTTYGPERPYGKGINITVPSEGRFVFPEGSLIPRTASLFVAPLVFSGKAPVGDTKDFNLNGSLEITVGAELTLVPGSSSATVKVAGYDGDGSDIDLSFAFEDGTPLPDIGLKVENKGNGVFTVEADSPDAYLDAAPAAELVGINTPPAQATALALADKLEPQRQKPLISPTGSKNIKAKAKQKNKNATKTTTADINSGCRSFRPTKGTNTLWGPLASEVKISPPLQALPGLKLPQSCAIDEVIPSNLIWTNKEKEDFNRGAFYKCSGGHLVQSATVDTADYCKKDASGQADINSLDVRLQAGASCLRSKGVKITCAWRTKALQTHFFNVHDTATKLEKNAINGSSSGSSEVQQKCDGVAQYADTHNKGHKLAAVNNPDNPAHAYLSFHHSVTMDGTPSGKPAATAFDVEDANEAVKARVNKAIAECNNDQASNRKLERIYPGTDDPHISIKGVCAGAAACTRKTVPPKKTRAVTAKKK